MREKRNYVVWGSSGHALVLTEIILGLGGQILAFFDNNHASKSILEGVPLYIGSSGFQDWYSTIDPSLEIDGLVAIGSPPGSIRLEIQKLFQQHGLYVRPLIAPSASVAKDVTIGAGTQVLPQANIAPGARIGSGCILNHFANVDHECIIGDGVHLAPRATLCGCVEVSDGAMIGAGAVVLPRITIGKNALVGAGAVVTKNIQDHMVVVGNPARFFRSTRH